MKVYLIVVFVCNAVLISTGQHCIKLCDVNYQEGNSQQPPVHGGQPQGAPGKRGPVGSTGPQGDSGPPGPKGEAGDELSTEVQALQDQVDSLKHQYTFVENILKSNRVTLCYVGIQDRSKVKDSQLTGSSMHYARSGDHHAAKHGRLFSTTGAGGWLAEDNDQDKWVVVDLERSMRIVAIAIQGNDLGGRRQWVTSFTVKYKDDGSSQFIDVADADNNPIVFPGNSDGSTVVINEFPTALNTRFIKIVPLKHHGYPTIRFDLLLC